jgi:hypothetical protein
MHFTEIFPEFSSAKKNTWTSVFLTSSISSTNRPMLTLSPFPLHSLVPRCTLPDPPGLLQPLVLVPEQEAELLVVYLAITVAVSALEQLCEILIVDPKFL